MAGWRQVRILEVIEPLTTIDPRRRPDETFEYIDVSSVSRESFSIQETSTLLGCDAPSRAKRLVHAGDVLFATIRPTLQRIAVVPGHLGGSVCSTGYFVLRPGPEVVDGFLFHYLFSQEFSDEMASLQRGASYPAVSDQDVKEHLMPLPPLPEQKRIVAILDEAFAGIATAVANAEKNLANARELFESHLNAVFEQRRDGWVEKALGDVCDFLNGYAFKSSDAVGSSNVQVIRMGNLYQNVLDLDRRPAFYPSAHAREFSRYILVEGNLIMSLTGTVDKEDYGYAVVVPKTERTLLLNQRIAKFIILKEDLLCREFLLYLLRSRQFLKALYGTARGVRQANLSTVTMRGIRISLPSMQEQQRLIGVFSSLEERTVSLQSVYRQKLNSLTELKQSILQKAFTGQLTANPDEALAEAGT